MVHTLDGDFVLVYREGSKQDLASGSTPGTLQVRISSDDGTIWTEPVTIADYDDGKEGVLWLAPGLHTVELMYYQQTTAVGRMFGDRLLMVTPL